MQRDLTLVDRESRQPKHGGFKKNAWRLSSSCLALTLVALAFSLKPWAACAQREQAVPEYVADSQASAYQSPPSLSKFEARRIRHRCRDQVTDPSAHKELRHCFEMHVAARRHWSECKRKPQIVNLHGHEKEEAVRHCALEKLGASNAPQR
jgi:hypothetical protein